MPAILLSFKCSMQTIFFTFRGSFELCAIEVTDIRRATTATMLVEGTVTVMSNFTCLCKHRFVRKHVRTKTLNFRLKWLRFRKQSSTDN